MPSRSPRKSTKGKSSASPEAKRRLTGISYFLLPFALITVLLNFPPSGEPWLQVKTAIKVVGAIVFCIWVTRFSLWQRDEYWRERGRDPKHAERFPRPPAE
jgi:hypothetical protein